MKLKGHTGCDRRFAEVSARSSPSSVQSRGIVGKGSFSSPEGSLVWVSARLLLTVFFTHLTYAPSFRTLCDGLSAEPSSSLASTDTPFYYGY